MTHPAALPDNGTRAVEGRDDVAHARLQLLAATRFQLAIHVPVLSLEAFSSAEELTELRRIATSGRGAEIRILLHDPGTIQRQGHRLLDLAQRLSSVVQIRTPSDEQEQPGQSAWLFNDSGGYLFQPNADRYEGRMALRDGAAQAPLRLQFDQLWERALPATMLQPLDL